MRHKVIIGIVLAIILCASEAFAQGAGVGPAPGVGLQDEGTTQGRVQILNCIGTGIVCSKSGVTGTLSVTVTGITIQTFTSGSGTYTTPANVKWIRIRLVGGGGGAAGSGTAAGTSPTIGGNTTFSTLTGSGGNFGIIASPGVNGGAASGGDLNIAGQNGGSGNGAANTAGLSGGSSILGFGGFGGPVNGPVPGLNASGYGGGGGGASAASGNPGGAGAAGGYVEKIINTPAATYSYAVGAAGTAGGAGTLGAAGGAGTAGVIIVEEHYI